MSVLQIVIAHGFLVESIEPGKFKVLNMVYYPAEDRHAPDTVTRNPDTGSISVLSESGAETVYSNIFEYLGYEQIAQ